MTPCEAIKPEEIELLICDELHTALGEERHTIFKAVPHTLMIGLTATPYFEQIKDYQKRGVVRKDERWLDLFTKKIHEMTLEEGIEKDILSPLETHMVRTSVPIHHINIESRGEYNNSELERYLNTEIRNGLIIAMLAGVEALPANITLSPKEKGEIAKIHGIIKGKKTALFGLSIAHIEGLSQKLKDKGISADTMHGHKTKTERDKVLAAHAAGDIQIILGVDALRLGWNSPSTEVGIYAAPTRSGTVAIQELGRILRTASGKEKAIAIQLVDEFTFRTQAPVLIPNIFDPYYILKGTQTGEVIKPKRTSHAEKKPKIAFSGADIRVITEDAYINQFLQERFNQSSLPELCEVLDGLVFRVQTEFALKPPIFQYRKIADAIPGKVSADVQNQALQALASIDTNVSDRGARLLTYLNLKTIFSVINPYLTGNAEVDSDLTQEVIFCVFNKLKSRGLSTTMRVVQQIYVFAETAVESFMGTSIAKSFIDERLQGRRLSLTNKEIGILAQEAQAETGVSPEAALQYIQYLHTAAAETPKGEDEVVKAVEEGALRTALNEILESLPQRSRTLVRSIYGLELRHDGTESNEELGKEFGVTRERIRQIEAKAIRKLRYPTRSQQLKDYLYGGEGYIKWGLERRRSFRGSLGVERLGLSERVSKKLKKAFIFTIPQLASMEHKRLVNIFIDDEQDLQKVEDRLFAFLDFNGENSDLIGNY